MPQKPEDFENALRKRWDGKDDSLFAGTTTVTNVGRAGQGQQKSKSLQNTGARAGQGQQQHSKSLQNGGDRAGQGQQLPKSLQKGGDRVVLEGGMGSRGKSEQTRGRVSYDVRHNVRQKKWTNKKWIADRYDERQKKWSNKKGIENRERDAPDQERQQRGQPGQPERRHTQTMRVG